jgi:hypothetical protein
VASLRRPAAWAVALLALGVACTTPALADPPVPGNTDTALHPDKSDFNESAKGHGSLSVAYLNTYVNGFFLDSNTEAPNGAVHSQSIALDLDYYPADKWSVHIGIPFVSNRYQGNLPHCPTTAPPQCANQPALNPPHPESQFLDDGNYHGTWADWRLGASYHTHFGNYYVTPSITASFPSHDYVFFANAAVAQRIWQVEIASTVEHQFDFSNWYYRLGYGYVFAQRVLGKNADYHKFNAELGYFFNDKLSLRAFTIGRIGNGYSAAELVPLTDGFTNNEWYHHDQTTEHSYFGVGVGVDCQIGDRYTWSTAVQRTVWGESVFDFKYAFETRLTRSF